MKKDTVRNSAPVSARLLNVKQAAQYLGATTWFVRTLGWEKKVPIIQLGNRWLFDRADLDMFVDQAKVTGQA